MKAKILLALMLSCCISTFAQQVPTYPVTEAAPLEMNGLQMGYHINSEEVKAVSDKGDFSRFSVKFFVTNTAPEAKIILHNTGFNLFNDISSSIVQFDCLNATGARLTSKSALLQANVCKILANVEDKDPVTNKMTINKRFVEVGFWIRPGETITTTAIMIVPLNQKPDIKATYLLNKGLVASAQYAQPSFANGQPGNYPPQGYQDPNQGYQPSQPTYYPFPGPGERFNNDHYYVIRNVWNNNYMGGTAQGPNTAKADIRQGIVQWDITPFNGSNTQYQIRNKFYGTYVTSGKPGPAELSTNNKYAGSVWAIERIAGSEKVRLKNVGNDTYLNIEYGNLQSTAIWNDAVSSQWILEGH